MKIAAVVVLYHPMDEIYRILKAIRGQFDKIFYIDNSDRINDYLQRLSCKDSEISYFFGGGENKGLAYALDYGCRRAENEGYRYVCLLDQDTYLSKDCMDKLSAVMQNEENVGLTAPNVINMRRNDSGHLAICGEPLYPNVTESVAWAITSGSLIDLKTYKKVGGIDTRLFIGQIDQDYCCRLLSYGYDIKRIGDALIYQEVGRLRIINFFGRKIKDPQYPKERYFYMFRNERYLRRKWGKAYKRQKVKLWKYLVIIILASQERSKKLSACVEGWHMGKDME